MKLININFNKPDKIIFASLFFISLSIFIFYVNFNAFENFGDQNEYVRLANIMLNKEPVNEFNKEFGLAQRTYLYPAIIASVNIFNNDLVITKITISIIQYSLYLLTVIFIANYASSFPKSKPKSSFPEFIDPKKGAQHYLDRYHNEPTYKSWYDKYYPNYTLEQATQLVISETKSKNKIIWHSVIAFGFLNPFLIQSTSLLLSDIFVTCFAVLSIFSLTRVDLTRSKFIFFSVGLFYASIMIKPVALIFLPIFVGIILFRFLKKKTD